MRRLSSPARRRARLDDDRILPLINIVFLLLIFFMVVGRLSASDPFEIEPVHSLSAGAPALEAPLVTIGRGGALALDGEVMDETALITGISQAGATGLRIKVDQSVEAARVVALLNRLKAAGVGEVKLMTVPSIEGAL
ncbi:MAG: biopolymer transporter ExbD [Pseudomonadota bacterium]